MVVTLVGCGTSSKPPQNPDGTGTTPPTGSGSARPVSDAPTETECSVLLEKTFKLALASRPADQQIDEAEQAKQKNEMRPTFIPKCQAMTRTRFDCANDAPNLDAMKACDE